MENLRRQVISLFIDNYHVLRKHFRFKASSRVLRLCSLILSLKDIRISVNEMEKAFRYIKQHTHLFSPFRYYMAPAAAFSIISEKSYDKAFNRIAACKRALKTAGIGPSSRLVPAAMVLFAASSEGSELVLAARALSIIRKMKDWNFSERYEELFAPAVLVAASEFPGKEVVSQSSNILRALDIRDPGQTRGLHFLFQIMSYYSGTPESAAERCAGIYSRLVKMKFRSPAMFYGSIGFLALSGLDFDLAVFEAMDTMNLLKLGKCFTVFEKEQAMLIASAIVAAVHLKEFSSDTFQLHSVIPAQVAACIL